MFYDCPAFITFQGVFLGKMRYWTHEGVLLNTRRCVIEHIKVCYSTHQSVLFNTRSDVLLNIHCTFRCVIQHTFRCVIQYTFSTLSYKKHRPYIGTKCLRIFTIKVKLLLMFFNTLSGGLFNTPSSVINTGLYFAITHLQMC